MNSSSSSESKEISPEMDIPGFQADTTSKEVLDDQNVSDLAAYLDFLEEIEAFRTKKIKTNFTDGIFTI